MVRRILFIVALWRLATSGGFIIVIPYFVLKTGYVAVRSCYRGVTKRWFPGTYEAAVHANISSHTDWDSFGSGKRRALTGRLRQALLVHVPPARGRSLSAFSFEERASNYPGASKDFVVYDENDQPAYYGRSLAGGRMTVWVA